MGWIEVVFGGVEAETPQGSVSSWLPFRAAVKHCFDLICIFVFSNRTSFLAPERNGINSARFFANPISREEEESYIQMVIPYLYVFFLPPDYIVVS